MNTFPDKMREIMLPKKDSEEQERLTDPLLKSHPAIKKSKTIDTSRYKLKPMTLSPRHDQEKKLGKNITDIRVSRGLEYSSANEQTPENSKPLEMKKEALSDGTTGQAPAILHTASSECENPKAEGA